MKIAVDVRELRYNRITGIGRFLLNFLRHITTFSKKDWEFIIVTDTNEISEFNINLKKEFIPSESSFFWDQIQLPRFLKKQKIDLFFSPYLKAPIYCPCKFVITIHDLLFLKFPFYKGIDKINKFIFFTTLGKILTKKSDRIIAVSNYSKRDIINTFNVIEEKISVIPNGVEKQFRPITDTIALEAMKQKYGIIKKYILFLGNFLPHKNVKGLITAYSRISVRLRNETQLVIVANKNRLFKEIHNLVEKLKLTQKVLFINFVDEQDLPALYSAAELLALPSFYEGFGLPVLEAMACGTAVIASNTTAIPELIGNAAIKINPNNNDELIAELNNLLNDSELRLQMRELGLNRAKEFLVEKSASRILGVMEEVLNEV